MAGFQYGTYEDLTKVYNGVDETNDSQNEEEEENFVLTTLLEAADEGNINEIEELLQNSPNINLNIYNKHLETALHFASAAGHEDIVRLLVQKGAYVHCKDKHQDSPLYWAARQGHLKVMECLIEAGAEKNAKNKVGQTALHAAVRYFQLDAVKYLCYSGADINIQDIHGETVLHMLAWLGSPKTICDVLTSAGCDLNVKNRNDETALHISAGRGSLECLQSLIAHGVDINAIDRRGSTPLHLACHCQHLPIIKELLISRCNMDALDHNGDTVLHIVCQSGNLSLVQILCANGCNVDLINKMGKTPLHISAKLGHTEIVRCLLLAGATIDLPSKNNITAEMMALARGKNETSELLSKLSSDRQETAIKQLLPSTTYLSKIKLKVFGESGVGKTHFIDSLKCGFFKNLLKRAGLKGIQASNSPSFPNPPGQSFAQLVNGKNRKRRNSLNLTAPNEYYTQGIDVQTCNISGVGELSIWEFSGYEAYYQFYDVFIGDVNCIHVVCFNPLQSLYCQLQELNFWLNLIKSCIPLSDPFGTEGKLQKRATMILVGVLPNPGKASRLFEEESDNWKRLQEFPKFMNSIFSADMQINPVVFVVDPDYPMSPQIRSLRSCIADLKNYICKELPRSSGFLESTVAVLPGWRRVLSSYPVVTWTNFVEYLRSTVNLLASEDHLKELIYKLQLMGEVTFVETTINQDEDLVILDVKWLCNGVLGRLLSYEVTSKCRPTGCFGSDDFQLLFPDCEAVELLQLLQALALCTRCDLGDDEDDMMNNRSFTRGTGFDMHTSNDLDSNNIVGPFSIPYIQECFTTEYELPCLNFVETLSGLWDRNDDRLAVNTIYGGIRYIPFCAHCNRDVTNDRNIKKQVRSIFSAASNNSIQNAYIRISSVSESVDNLSILSHHSAESSSRQSISLSPSTPPLTPSPFFPVTSSYKSKIHHNYLVQLFPRLQVMLRRHYLPDNSNSEVDLYQWHWGSKYCRGLLEVLITYETRDHINQLVRSNSGNDANLDNQNGTKCFCNCSKGVIELKCRGPSDMAAELFEFAESIKQVIHNTIQISCPSFDYKQEILSGLHLSDHRKIIRSYSQKELVQAVTASGHDATVSFVENTGRECFESLLDLVAFGSDGIHENLVFCPDLPASSLSLYVRRKLAALLDPSDTRGCDWCMLAILLGLSEQMPSFESAEGCLSSTNRVIGMWSRQDTKEKVATIGILISKLVDLGRLDAVNVLTSLGPLYRHYKFDAKTDEQEQTFDHNQEMETNHYFSGEGSALFRQLYGANTDLRENSFADA